MRKNILFITGTRADFSKLKSLMRCVESDHEFDSYIFATGMHTLSRYGMTVAEIHKEDFRNVHVYMNQMLDEPSDVILANTISGLSRYVKEYSPDMIVVHGDRIETLAGAIVGSLNNVLVGHIEGGERSGTIDELIRHAVTKLSHLHFVANDEAAARLIQMGECKESIFVIGSPDIDLMLSKELPALQEAKRRYDIEFNDYSIVMFHSVTTEIADVSRQANELVTALLQTQENYIIIYPNNDPGNAQIVEAYKRLTADRRYKIHSSLRFECFLTLLKNAKCIIGNSSAGIREAPVYGIPTINIGTRQQDRFHYESIYNIDAKSDEIVRAIDSINHSRPPYEKCLHFGRGDSAQKFMQIIKQENVWSTSHQKRFCDL